jgi:hypothetical protein
MQTQTQAQAAAPVQVPSAEEFLGRYGDLIDDRVAEVVEEILAERDAARPRVRPRPGLTALALLLATGATVLLRHDTLAAAAVWLSVAVIYLVVGWTTLNKGGPYSGLDANP